MAEVWFIRHGESNSNAGTRTTDPATPVLTEKGWEQARALSLRFPEAPGLIVMTPFIRTQQTAAPTLERFPDTQCEIWPLQEFVGLAAAKYDGTTVTERGPMMREYWNRADPDYVDGPGAESFSSLIARVRDGFARLQQRPEPFVAVFTHGYVIEVARFILARPDMPVQDLMKTFPTHRFAATNCSVMRLSADAAGVRLHPDELKAFEEAYAAASKKNTGPAPPRGNPAPDI